MAELWYNSSFHTSLGCSPFKALYGIEPNFGAMPNIGGATDEVLADITVERHAFLDLLKEQLLRAQVRMKHQADKHRSDRHFSMGDDVLLKLQPHVQSSVVVRPSAKISLRYYGPYKVLVRVGEAAYKIQLSVGSKIHDVFHVSQLKPFTANYTPVFADLPVTMDLSSGTFPPREIVERRLVKKGNAAMPQIKVRWTNLPDDCTTWEDYYVLKKRFPDVELWKELPAQGGDSVTSPSPEVMVTDTCVDPG
jgi:ribosomal protein L21E